MHNLATFVEEFLADATAWKADLGRQDDVIALTPHDHLVSVEAVAGRQAHGLAVAVGEHRGGVGNAGAGIGHVGPPQHA